MVISNPSPSEKVSFFCAKCGTIFVHEFRSYVPSFTHYDVPLTCHNPKCKSTDLLRLGKVKDDET